MGTEYRVKRGEKTQVVTILEDRGDVVVLELDGVRQEVSTHALPDGRTAIRSQDQQLLLRARPTRTGLLLVNGHVQRRFEVVDARVAWLGNAGAGKGAAGGRVTASMPGKVVRLLVKVDDIVPPGGVVAVLEAMKMENDVKSAGGGKVVEVAVKEGGEVESGALIVRLEPLS